MIGLGLFSYSLSLPYYKDRKAADRLLIESHGIEKKDYYNKDTELRTSKTTLMDLDQGSQSLLQ